MWIVTTVIGFINLVIGLDLVLVIWHAVPSHEPAATWIFLIGFVLFGCAGLLFAIAVNQFSKAEQAAKTAGHVDHFPGS